MVVGVMLSLRLMREAIIDDLESITLATDSVLFACSLTTPFTVSCLLLSLMENQHATPITSLLYVRGSLWHVVVLNAFVSSSAVVVEVLRTSQCHDVAHPSWAHILKLAGLPLRLVEWLDQLAAV